MRGGGETSKVEVKKRIPVKWQTSPTCVSIQKACRRCESEDQAINLCISLFSDITTDRGGSYVIVIAIGRDSPQGGGQPISFDRLPIS